MLLTVHVKKLDMTFERDWDALPESSRAYLAQYGFKQAVNDPHASIKRSDYANGEAGDAKWLADVGQAVADRIDQIDSGNVPGTRMTGTANKKLARARKMVAAFESLSDDEFAAVLERFVETRAAA